MILTRNSILGTAMSLSVLIANQAHANAIVKSCTNSNDGDYYLNLVINDDTLVADGGNWDHGNYGRWSDIAIKNIEQSSATETTYTIKYGSDTVLIKIPNDAISGKLSQFQVALGPISTFDCE